jgi:meiotic recombination protein SPO11
LKCDREDLGIYASSKGYFAGKMLIKTPGVAAWTDCTLVGNNGLPVRSDAIDTYEIRNNGATAIVVIEKDGIFNRLTEDKIWSKVPVIIITGKGFPDLATRMFTKRLANELKLPVIGLCDWNPFGIALLLTYKFGSLRMGETGFKYAVDLKMGGLLSSQIDELEIPESCRQPMTEVDKSKATIMLDGNLMLDEANFSNHPATLQDVRTMRAELQEMLHRGYKLELESIMSQGMDYFSEIYLPNLLTKKSWQTKGHNSRWQRRRQESRHGEEEEHGEEHREEHLHKRRRCGAYTTIDCECPRGAGS